MARKFNPYASVKKTVELVFLSAVMDLVIRFSQAALPDMPGLFCLVTAQVTQDRFEYRASG